MKKVLLIFLAFILLAWLALPAAAETVRTTISSLPELSAPDITDVLPIVNSGATKKITLQNLFLTPAGLPELTTPAASDVLPIVSGSAAKKLSLENLFKNVSAGTVGAPGLAFIDDQDTGLYLIGAANVGLSLGGVLAFDFSASAFNLMDKVIYGSAEANGDLILQPTSNATKASSRIELCNFLYATADGMLGWAYNADSNGASVDFNIVGYLGSTSRARDFKIGSGKGYSYIMSSWDGSEMLLTHSCNVTMAAGKRFKPGEVTYSTSMNADVAGTIKDLVYCTTDNKVYVCTATGAAGSATWAALN